MFAAREENMDNKTTITLKAGQAEYVVKGSDRVVNGTTGKNLFVLNQAHPLPKELSVTLQKYLHY